MSDYIVVETRDLQPDEGTCQSCQRDQLRFLHIVTNGGPLRSICADCARKRCPGYKPTLVERDLIARDNLRSIWHEGWEKTSKGNLTRLVEGRDEGGFIMIRVTIFKKSSGYCYCIARRSNNITYSRRVYDSLDDAQMGVFEALYPKDS